MADQDNSALKELILGTLFFGIVVALAGVWWVQDKKMYLLGLAVGIFLSIWRAIHIQRSLEILLDYEEKTARTKMALSYAIRTLTVVFVLAVMLVWEMGTLSILMCFAGLFGLKAGALLQPYIHKYMNKLTYKSRVKK